MKKGISLITLTITIIVVIILASATIFSLANNNMIFNANQAVFKNNVKAYMSELSLYVSSKMLEEDYEVSVNTNPDLTIEKVITSIKEEDKNKFKIIDNELYYITGKNNSRETYWAEEAGCNIYLEGELTDSVWKEKNGVYCYSPSLVGFSKENLNYITYSLFGNEKRFNALRSPEPKNWYNYSKNKQNWANVVTVNGEKEVYLVWIPRYAYKVIDNKIDIVFTDVNNNYVDSQGVEKNALDDGYKKHSAFTLDFSDEGKGIKELTGFWVSKYEVTDIVFTDFTLNKIDSTHFEVKNVTGSGLYSFKYYVNNELKGENNNAKFVFDQFNAGVTYEIKVEAYDYYGNLVESKVKTITPANVPTYNLANAPDLTGFNKNTTYYLTYDQNGNEQRVKMAGNSAPANWYNYSKEQKQWANIVTSNNGEEVYLVWIPRYEYIVLNGGKIDIAFIPATKTTPTLGYKIPAAFTVDFTDEGKGKKELSGFWTSKFEISQ